jgi:BMFP domain-containing protein YqiC
MGFAATSFSEGDDPRDMGEMMRSMCGPQAVDQAVRQAISMCWAMLPKERKTVQDVESEIRRLVDRALKNLREDFESFGLPGAQ